MEEEELLMHHLHLKYRETGKLRDYVKSHLVVRVKLVLG